MKEVPTSRVTNSGAARIVSGSVTGGMARIFDTPEGSSPRTIKTLMTGEEGAGDEAPEMFIRIASRSELDAGANLYKYDLWDCINGQVSSRETGTVRLNGDFIATSSGDSEEGVFNNIVRGFVTTSGREIRFDTSRERSVTQDFLAPEGRLSNSQIIVTPLNEIVSKQRANSNGETEKSYSISSFSGNSVADLRFLSGATKMSFLRSGVEQNFTGSSEFRDTFYASSPTSSQAVAAGAFDFAADSFFSGELDSPSLDSRGISCSPRVDVTVSISMASPAMTAIRQECEGIRLDGFQMCQSDAVQEAFQNYNSVCQQ
jgi:hypothetical protein